MPKFICTESCVCGRGVLWSPGDAYEGEEKPTKYFDEVGAEAVDIPLSPTNSREHAVYNMRAVECATYIRTHYGEEINPRDPDYAQKALAILRKGRYTPAEIEETRPDMLPVTKKQIEQRIRESNPGIKIPVASLRSKASLLEYEETLKNKAIMKDMI